MKSISITDKYGNQVEKYSYKFNENTGEQTRVLTKIPEDLLDDDLINYYLNADHMELYDSENPVHTEGMQGDNKVNEYGKSQSELKREKAVKAAKIAAADHAEEVAKQEKKQNELNVLREMYLELSGKEKAPTWGKARFEKEIQALEEQAAQNLSTGGGPNEEPPG